MEPQICWGHDLDLFGSRDVIGHLTIDHLVSDHVAKFRGDRPTELGDLA